MDTKQLKRIADAIEEILRLVKKDMEPKKKQKGDLLIPDPLVSVPNFSWMVAILVRRHVPILDNGGTGLMDLGSER